MGACGRSTVSCSVFYQWLCKLLRQKAVGGSAFHMRDTFPVSACPLEFLLAPPSVFLGTHLFSPVALPPLLFKSS